MPAAYRTYGSVHPVSALDVREGSVLIVDDDSANVAFMVRLLEREGYTGVRGTTSARQALHALHGETIDLLVLDLHMPQLDGFGVLNELRRIPGGDLTPVLVLTGDDSSDARNRALASGARDF